MNYTAAYETALNRFRECSIEDMARNSGYSLEGDALIFGLFGKRFRLEYPGGRIIPVDSKHDELPLATQILVLHYVTSPQGVLEEGKLISFKELPGGAMYIKPFTGRAIDPLIRTFGQDPESLRDIVIGLGGQSNSLGDVGVTYRVFPHIPVTLILWRGDDEFPPSGTILFDGSAASILPTEDFAVLASTVVFQLKRLKKA